MLARQEPRQQGDQAEARLRYGAAYLVARGLLTDEAGATIATDPDVQMLIGVAMGGVAEGWYYLARRFGWSK